MAVVANMSYVENYDKEVHVLRYKPASICVQYLYKYVLRQSHQK